jgi:hypothetical protein
MLGYMGTVASSVWVPTLFDPAASSQVTLGPGEFPRHHIPYFGLPTSVARPDRSPNPALLRSSL